MCLCVCGWVLVSECPSISPLEDERLVRLGLPRKRSMRWNGEKTMAAVAGDLFHVIRATFKSASHCKNQLERAANKTSERTRLKLGGPITTMDEYVLLGVVTVATLWHV